MVKFPSVSGDETVGLSSGDIDSEINVQGPWDILLGKLSKMFVRSRGSFRSLITDHPHTQLKILMFFLCNLNAW